MTAERPTDPEPCCEGLIVEIDSFDPKKVIADFIREWTEKHHRYIAAYRARLASLEKERDERGAALQLADKRLAEWAFCATCDHPLRDHESPYGEPPGGPCEHEYPWCRCRSFLARTRPAPPHDSEEG